jgi:hypothetical protein
MNYSNELCQLVIKNMMVVEKAPYVAEQVAKRLFEKINKRIEDCIEKQAGWKGEYDLSPKDGETTFAPNDWPENENGEYLAYYSLSCKTADSDNEQRWLSRMLGLEGSCMLLLFYVHDSYFKSDALQKREFENLSRDPRLVKAGFMFDRNDLKSGIYLPFSFSPDKVADEYPDFDESLTPLGDVLGALVGANGVFDDFVKKICQASIDLEAGE